MSFITYVYIFILRVNLFFPLNQSISCTVRPKNITYVISKDKMLTFKDFSKIFFYFEGNVLYSQITDTRPTRQLQSTYQKYSPDFGLSEKHCLENSPCGSECVSGSQPTNKKRQGSRQQGGITLFLSVDTIGRYTIGRQLVFSNIDRPSGSGRTVNKLCRRFGLVIKH